MAVTIHVNGKSNSLVHKGSMGIAKSTIPDVCKTPTPGGPVPIPYPVIVSMSSDLKKGSKKVKFDGGNSAAIKGSEFSRCTGDEPGTAGGVKSSTNMKEATWILYSFDVKIEGKNACRLSDKMLMNHGNTACLGGAFNPFVVPGIGEIIDVLCQDMCDHENGAQEGKHRRSSNDLEKQCRDSGKYDPHVLFRQRIPTPTGFSTKHTKPDAITANHSQCFDFKLCGDRPRGDQLDRQAAIAEGARPIIISCDECASCDPSCEC
ncbi:MAG: DUF4150 domain-containing protein [Gammaproteobacteria bacterium]|nr:DUF4150 domain-containing protein [Gammaproteobacteria bacterium]